jgi:two-component system LytT family response regulator
MIVEDDMLIAKGLEAIIKSIDDNLDISITGYAEEALRYIENNHYDVFLLDIQLEDYSGIELAKKIRDRDEYKLTPIIFITAIPTRELIAFKEIHCYDYIVKPFTEKEVREALETIIHHGIRKEDKSEIFKINQKSYSYILKQDEIIYIESKNKNLLLVTRSEEIKLSNYSLSKILEELGTGFMQCHRGYIIKEKTKL